MYFYQLCIEITFSITCVWHEIQHHWLVLLVGFWVSTRKWGQLIAASRHSRLPHHCRAAPMLTQLITNL
jgi:hypothetical protein